MEKINWNSYLFLKMDLNEFKNYYENNKERFKNYCEIIIDNEGNIYQPIYSGHIMILAYLTEKEMQDNEEFTKEKLYNTELEEHLEITKAISIWYDFQYISCKTVINEKQQNTLDFLINNNLIVEKIFKKEILKYETAKIF